MSLPIEPLAHSPRNGAQRIGTSERTFYSLMAAGEIRSFKVGKRRLVLDTELQAFLKRKAAGSIKA